MNARGQFYKVVLEDVLNQLCFKNLECRIESVSSSMIERRKTKNVSFPILITLSADFFIGNIWSQIMSREKIYCNNTLNGQSNNGRTFIYFFNFKYSTELLENKCVIEIVSRQTYVSLGRLIKPWIFGCIYVPKVQ